MKNNDIPYSMAKLPTIYGDFDIYVFKEGSLEHAALIKQWNADVVPLVRLHSRCITGEVFGSLRCDCREQRDSALEQIGDEGGIFLYLDQEGRGIGLYDKIKAYGLQDNGRDTVDANVELGLPADARDYSVAIAFLKEQLMYQLAGYVDGGTLFIRLLTNDPKKIIAVEEADIQVERVPLIIPPNEHNRPYLEAKEREMNHHLGFGWAKDYSKAIRNIRKRIARRKEIAGLETAKAKLRS